MKKKLTFFLMLLSNVGYTQNNTYTEFMVGGVKSLPLSNFIRNDKTEINGGKKLYLFRSYFLIVFQSLIFILQQV